MARDYLQPIKKFLIKNLDLFLILSTSVRFCPNKITSKLANKKYTYAIHNDMILF